MNRIANDPEQLHAQAIKAYQAGQCQEAAVLLRQAININPDMAAYHGNLAVFLRGIASVAERIDCYRRAVALEPNNPIYLANMAAVLSEAQRYADAELHARTALSLAPERAETWHNLGTALAGQQKWAEAAEAYCRCVALGLRDEKLLLKTARICLQAENEADAESMFRTLLAQNPAHPDALIELGNLLKKQSRYGEAQACYERLLAQDPQCGQAMINLGTVAHEKGEYERALQHYQEALHRLPEHPALWHNLASSLSYSPSTTAREARGILSGFEAHIGAKIERYRSYSQTREPNRRLRIGYVSADFRAHPVGYLILPIIEGHQRFEFEIVCYYNDRREDAWTQAIRTAADKWVSITDLDDSQLAARIHTDRIDILVDLAGHSQGNRLLAFAQKPAPVQVTWLGYVTTTGLKAIDWRLTHTVADPEGVEAEYSEKLWRLPSALWCFRPHPEMPGVKASPCQTKGYVTFGSMNRFSKNSQIALIAWAEILNRLPTSRMLMCVPSELQKELVDVFGQRGVAAERLTFFTPGGHKQFWAQHDCIDIVLDPFPFNGGMTTLESLWLGVPVVSCCGTMDSRADSFPSRFASRMGKTFLSALGLQELVANTISGYIEIAVELGKDPSRIAALRGEIRQRMRASPMMDEMRFVGELEAAYRSMWQSYCECAHAAP